MGFFKSEISYSNLPKHDVLLFSIYLSILLIQIIEILENRIYRKAKKTCFGKFVSKAYIPLKTHTILVLQFH